MIVDIGPVAHGGACVARHEGRVIFVRHALPGERVRVEITERKKSYWRGDAVEILDASPDRVPPPCRYAGTCGGCDFQHVSAPGQLRLKTAVLREQLTRLAGLPESEVSDYTVEALPGGLLGWRTRMQYSVDNIGRPGLRGHRSRDLVPIDDCLIADDRIRATDVLRRNWKGSNVVGVAASDADEVSVYTQRDRRGKARLVSGPPLAEHIVSGHWFRLDAEAFWQPHTLAADTLASRVTELSQPADAETVWDLYAGAGLFAAVLADEVGPSGRVIAVESDTRAATAANLADLPQVEVRRSDVAEAVHHLPSPDIVVLDPPRSGAGADLVKAIAAADPRVITYVACDPAALARDLKTFAANGYSISTLEAYDAFPMTHHFETIAVLRRD